MNLIKNVEGTWDASKGRVRGDLDTIQRTMNALQAQLDALSTQVNTPATVAAPIIAGNNTVTVPTGNFLSVVATNGGLTGDGTPANPLVAAGASFSGVTLATPSALTGVGTGGSPLAVNPDGTTIKIVANQLVASAAGMGISSFGITGATPAFNGVAGAGGFSVAPNTVLTTIPGVANKVILVLKMYVYANQNDAGANNALFSPTTALQVVYNMAGFPIALTPLATVLQAAVGTHNSASINEPTAALTSSVVSAYQGVDVLVRTDNGVACVSTANKFIQTSGTFTVIYALI